MISVIQTFHSIIFYRRKGPTAEDISQERTEHRDAAISYQKKVTDFYEEAATDGGAAPGNKESVVQFTDSITSFFT